MPIRHWPVIDWGETKIMMGANGRATVTAELLNQQGMVPENE